MVRILQISDPHYGSASDARTRFGAVRDLANSKGVDALFVLGDVVGKDRAEDLLSKTEDPKMFQNVYMQIQRLKQQTGLGDDELLDLIVEKQPEAKQLVDIYRKGRKSIDDFFVANSGEIGKVLNEEISKVRAKTVYQLGNH